MFRALISVLPCKFKGCPAITPVPVTKHYRAEFGKKDTYFTCLIYCALRHKITCLWRKKKKFPYFLSKDTHKKIYLALRCDLHNLFLQDKCICAPENHNFNVRFPC